MDKDVVIALITTVGTMSGAFFGMYKSLKSHINKKSDEQRLSVDMSVQKLNGMLTSVLHSFDSPCWLKIAYTDQNGNVVFRMSEINEQYSEIFKIHRSNYIGRTDIEAGHNREDANKFYVNDLEVFGTGIAKTYKEEINGNVMFFRKIRVQSPDGVSKGVFGYQIYPCKDECKNENYEINK